MDEESPCLLSDNVLNALLVKECSAQAQETKSDSEDSMKTLLTCSKSLQRSSSVQEIFDASSDHELQTDVRNCNAMLRMMKKRIGVIKNMSRKMRVPNQSVFVDQLRAEVQTTLRKVLSIAQLVEGGPLRIKFLAIERAAAALLKQNELTWAASKAEKGTGIKRKRTKPRSARKATEASNGLLSREKSSDSDVVPIAFEEVDESLVVDLTLATDDDSVCLSSDELRNPSPSTHKSSTELVRPLESDLCAPSKRLCRRPKLNSQSQQSNQGSEGLAQESYRRSSRPHVLRTRLDPKPSTNKSHPGSLSSTHNSNRESVSSSQQSCGDSFRSSEKSHSESQQPTEKSHPHPKWKSPILSERSTSRLPSPTRFPGVTSLDNSPQMPPKKIGNLSSHISIHRHSAKMSEGESSSSNTILLESTSAVSNLPIAFSSSHEESEMMSPETSAIKLNSSELQPSVLSGLKRINRMSVKQISDSVLDKMSTSRHNFRPRTTEASPTSTFIDAAVQISPAERISILVNCPVSVTEERKLNLLFTKFGEKIKRVPSSMTKLFSDEQIAFLRNAKK